MYLLCLAGPPSVQEIRWSERNPTDDSLVCTSSSRFFTPNLRNGPHCAILVPGGRNMIRPVVSNEKVELYPRGHEICHKQEGAGRSSKELMSFMESSLIPFSSCTGFSYCICLALLGLARVICSRAASR